LRQHGRHDHGALLQKINFQFAAFHFSANTRCSSPLCRLIALIAAGHRFDFRAHI
jgi:hypothetical protein